MWDLQGQLKGSSGSGSGALLGGGGGARSCGERREVVPRPPIVLHTPQSTQMVLSPITGGLGAGLGAQHRCDGAYWPEAGGCQVRRALPTARAILPATWKCAAAQPSSLLPPAPSQPPALTSQRCCFRRGVGDQAGPGCEARRGEGWWGWRWQLLGRHSQEGWEQWEGGGLTPSSHCTRWGLPHTKRTQ